MEESKVIKNHLKFKYIHYGSFNFIKIIRGTELFYLPLIQNLTYKLKPRPTQGTRTSTPLQLSW